MIKLSSSLPALHLHGGTSSGSSGGHAQQPLQQPLPRHLQAQQQVLQTSGSSHNAHNAIRQITGLLTQPNAVQQHNDRLVQLTTDFLLTQQQAGSQGDDDPILVSAVEENVPPNTPHCPAELKALLASLTSQDFDLSPTIATLEIQLLRLFKQLLKQTDNRKCLGKDGVEILLKLLQSKLRTKKTEVVAELCNIVLHACYEKANVLHITNVNMVGQNGSNINGTMMLLNCIYHRDAGVVSAALGALQAVCYVPQGRMTLRHNFEVLNKLVTFLAHRDQTIRSRALGTIHNLSVDAVSITPLVNTGCISILIHLLTTITEQESDHHATQESQGEMISIALGTLQNLTRDQTARDVALEAGAMLVVSQMLMSPFVGCQIAALGAFMNLTPSESQSIEEQVAMKELLAEAIALGAIQSCLFEDHE